MVSWKYMRGSVLFRNIIVLISAVCTGCLPTEASQKSFSTYEEFAKSELPAEILWKVIAREGRSKSYDQIVPLDGGTVGIANFAVGGLASLYRFMVT